MKKRVLSLLLALSLIFSLATVTGVTVSAATIDSVAPATGDGTANNPYQIGTAGELYWFAQKVNDGETAICAVLTADIVVNEGGVLDDNGDLKDGDFAAWPMIGYNIDYIGTFDGAGHIISGVYLDGGYMQGVGLFGRVGSGGKVCNLGVTDSYFKGNSYWNGAVCGFINEGTIENCYADATVFGYNSGGGVCGQSASSGTITNCYSVGKVSGNSNVGGVCGYNYGEVTNCYYDSTVYSGDAIGTNEGTAVEVQGKSTAQFASGEVAYLLNGKTSEGELVWGQTIGTDDYPVFNDGSNTVYVTTGGVFYNNDGNEGEHKHNIVDGKCTACGTYVISTAEQLFSFAEAVNGGETAINAVLTADITINEGVLDADGNLNSGDFEAWPMISYNIYYIGTFDGAGHIISGVYLDGGNTQGVGLFGKVGSGGKVCNLGVTDSYFKGNSYWTGAVCGENKGTIENCYADATVVGKNSVGGVCGQNGGGTITNCYSVGKVSGNSDVGGVCGCNYGVVTNCYNAGAVSGNSAVGGVCGQNGRDGTITNCYSVGKVSGNSDVGGVCGYNYREVTNCYYDSTVYSGDAIGTNEGTAVDVSGKSTAQFASGEVCYLLNGKTSEGELVWGQKIGTDDYPVFNDGSNTVYSTTGCVSYNNDGIVGEQEHNIVDGKCTACGLYVISTAEQLFSFAENVRLKNTEIDAVLTADITVNEGVLDADGNLNSGEFDAWTPIGRSSSTYSGTFDGAGHTISGLYFNSSSTQNIGLFGCVGKNGVVRNVGVVDSYFNGGTYVGGVCAYNEGTIANCYSIATVGGGNYIGGICGYNLGIVANCYSIAKVSGGNVNIGGVCGFMLKGAIINCYYDKNEYTGEAVSWTAHDATLTDVYGITPAQFESGEAAYMLSQGCKIGSVTYDGSIWGQEIGKDKSPVLGGKKVYVTTGCVSYNNDGNEGEKAHNFENGICTVCGSYNISNVSELKSFAAAVNGGETAINAVLTADITVNEDVLGLDGNLNSGEFETWTPIGNNDNPYNGTFDGAGHYISGLYLNESSEGRGGLFEYVGENGVVTNVGVTDCYFNARTSVGGLCAANYGKITNCFVRGTVYGSTCVGGLCAANYGEIANCYAVAAVSRQYYSGSFCGYNDGTITNCCAYGGNAVGTNNHGTSDNVFSKKIAQFKSGEVAYTLNLNDGTDDDVWGQTIGTDDYPVLGGAKVYSTTGCVIYTNNAELNGTVKEHGEFVNGMCPDCGEYKAAEEIDGVYQIGTVTDLYWLAQAVNRGNNTINAVLTADITVNQNVLNENGELSEGSFKDWTPIGDYDNGIPYNGEFDGAGHTVSGLYFNDASAGYVGLFGCVGENGGVINVGVVDSYLSGNYSVGGVCGINEGHIGLCYFTGTVSGYSGVGGVCGGNIGLILSCYSAGVLSGKEYVGGLCGDNYGQIGFCYYDSTVYGGGAIGYAGGTVQNVLGKTTAQFASGEVAYMLNFNPSNLYWGQTIGTDKYPVFHNDNNTVYATTGCVTYTNNAELSGKEKEHSEFVNGICPDCGQYQAAELNEEIGVYEISNAGQLYWFAAQVNGGNNTINAVLKADITVNENVLKSDGTLNGSGFMAWTPIGRSSSAYSGTFDGAGHTVSGLYFNDASANDVGLFGCVGENGVVSNVGIVDSYLSGNYSVGGVCGYNEGEITNCYSVGNVSGEGNVGGICGENYGTVTNCYYDSTVCGGRAIGYGDGDSDNVLGKTTAQFTCGEVCYLLQSTQKADENGIVPQVWGQTIGTDKYPTVHNDNNTVYVTTGCVIYTNNAELSGTAKEHSEFVNGICPDCGEYEAAVQNTETGVYEISNAGQLYWFAAQVNGGNTEIDAVLTADITVNQDVLKADGTLNGSGFMAWTPIGDYENNQYNGTFDGAGHTVSGLYFNNTSACDVGFIGCVGENGVVSNVGIVDSYINADEYVGGICGDNLGKVINCYNSGTVNGTLDIGGVCGYNEGEITNCYSVGKVSGDECVGGVCGYNKGEITNCYSVDKVSGEYYVGGICGENYGTLANCYYNSTVYGGDAVGHDEGTVDNVLGKTTAQFASGEVAYLLNQNDENADDVWGQNIDNDKTKELYPVLGGAKVYNALAYGQCVNNPGESTGYKYSNKEVVYAEHDMTQIKAKAPTCTEEGNLEYWICSYEDGVYYKNEAGTEKYASYDEIKIRATGHTKQIIPGKSATCTESGLTEGKKCSVCGEILVAQEVIKAKGHTYVKVAEVPATVDSTGTKEHYVCSVCGKLFDMDKNEVASDELVIPKLEITVTYGDVNGDGKINLIDLISMRKYLAKWNVDVDLSAIDCNADGKINLLDLILLRKYLAKWNVVLGPQK